MSDSAKIFTSQYWGEQHLHTGLEIAKRVKAGKHGSWRKAVRQLQRAAAHYERAAMRLGNDTCEEASMAKNIRAYATKFGQSFSLQNHRPA